MATINLRKATEYISFSDEPQARRYALKTDDKSLRTAQKKIDQIRDGMSEADSDQMAKLMREVIDAFVIDGGQMFDDAVEYVSGGDKSLTADDLVIHLFPLYDYVCERILALSANVTKARVAHYLEPDQQSAFKVI